MHWIVTHLINIKLHSRLQCSMEILGVIINLRLGVFPSIQCCMLFSLFVNVHGHNGVQLKSPPPNTSRFGFYFFLQCLLYY